MSPVPKGRLAVPQTPIQPLVSLLHQLRATIERIDDAAYTTPPVGRSSGGVGGHVRHCLDHVSALLTATRTGVCEYDRRRRNTQVETSRDAATARIDALTAMVTGLDPIVLDEPVLVESQLEPGGAMILTRSSICRELAFVISHTIHHNALIGQMLRGRGVCLDARFGVAPVTPLEPVAPQRIAIYETSSCAR
jgi:uncharacterized damage-inducible protein DinB